MIKILWQGFNKYFKFIIIHCFNYELSIMRKEKEAPRFALTFTCIKCLVSIFLHRKWFFYHVLIDPISFSQFLKFSWSIFKNSNFLINCQKVFIIYLSNLCVLFYCLYSLLFNILLNILILNILLIFGSIPFFRIFNFNSIQSAYSHNFIIVIFLIWYSCVDIIYWNISKLLYSFQNNMHKFNIQARS